MHHELQELHSNLDSYVYHMLEDKDIEKKVKNRIEFSLYPTQKSRLSIRTLHYHEFGSWLIQEVDTDESRRCLCINPLYYSSDNHKEKSRKMLENLDLPFNIMMDLDCKKGNERLFLQDFKHSDGSLKSSLNILLEKLHHDPYCVYADLSRSGLGVKAIFTVFSDQIRSIDSHLVQNNGRGDIPTLKFLHHQNAKCVLKHLRDKYGLKLYKGKDNYLDKQAMFNAVQPTFTSNGMVFHFNPDNRIFSYSIPGSEIESFKNRNKKTNTLLTNGKSTVLTENKLTDINNNFCDKFRIYYNQNIADCDCFISENIFGHYSCPLHIRALYSLKYVSENNREFFYELFLKNVGVDSHMRERFSTYDLWVNNIKSLSEKDNRTTTLFNIFKPIVSFNSVFQFKENADFFGNSYDEVMAIKKYIDEVYDKLKSILDMKDVIVLKALANSGKTTAIFKYLIEKIAKNPKGIYVFISPKNSLLQQQICIIRKNFPDLNIQENFDKKVVRTNKIKNGTIIFSSTVKGILLNNVDILVIDEVHNLTNYSEKIISKQNSAKKTILISATPELYLIGMRDYYYLTFQKSNSNKQPVNVIYTSKADELVRSMLDKSKKQLIYYQNLSKHNEFINYSNGIGVTMESLSSACKTQHYDYVLNNQVLHNNHYITTSTISDGINFLNLTWDDLIIITRRETPFDIYQIVNRFRNASNINVTIITSNKKEYYTGQIDFRRLEDAYQENVDDLNMEADILNKIKQRVDRDDLVGIKGIPQYGNEYIANEDYIKLVKYKETIQHYFELYKNVFEEALSYYFHVLVLKDIPINNIKSEPDYTSEMQEIWNKIGRIYIKIRRFRDTLPEFDMLHDILSNHLTVKSIDAIGQYYEIIQENYGFFNGKFNQFYYAESLIAKLTGSKTDPFALTMGNQNLYRLAISKLENDILMNCSNDELSVGDQAFRKLRYEVDDFIVGLINKAGKNRVLLKDLIALFNLNHNSYKNFQRKYGKYDRNFFKLDNEGRSLSVFLRKNTHYFEIKRIGKDRHTYVILKKENLA